VLPIKKPVQVVPRQGSTSDGGAIYFDSRNTNLNAGKATVANNFIRDYGSNSIQHAEGIYLDDDTSNVIVSGNVIGPSAAGLGIPMNTIINGGCCNTWTGNIIDVGSTAQEWVSGWSPPGGGGAIYFNWTGPNVFTDNIIMANYSGATNTCCLDWGGGGWDQGGGYPSNMGNISGNVYWNYGGGDTANLARGNIVSDSNPINEDPQISGYLYTIAANSPVYNSPVNFPPLKGGWGPPGFIIPSSSNHSDP
jgi:hypothetical protein